MKTLTFWLCLLPVLLFSQPRKAHHNPTLKTADALIELRDSLRAIKKDTLIRTTLRRVNAFQSIRLLMQTDSMWSPRISAVTEENVRLVFKETQLRRVLNILQTKHPITKDSAQKFPNLYKVLNADASQLKLQIFDGLNEEEVNLYNQFSLNNDLPDMRENGDMPRIESYDFKPAGGIPSQQQIILAAAAFIAERFKQEINIAFLEKFNTELDETPIGLMMPETRRMLDINRLTHAPSLSVSLRTSFESDAQNLLGNLVVALRDSVKGFRNLLPDKRSDDRLQYLSGMLEMLQDLRKGDNFQQVLASAARLHGDTARYTFDNHISFVNLLSNNLKSSEFENAYLDIQNFQNTDQIKYFFALLYHQDEPLFERLGLVSDSLRTSFKSYIPRMSQVIVTFNRLNKIMDAYENRNTSDKKFSVSDYSNYIGSLIDIIELTNSFSNRPDAVVATKILPVARRTVETYQALEQKEYGSVLNNTVFLLQQFAPDTVGASKEVQAKRQRYDRLLSRYSFYVSFMCDFLAAKSEAQLKNVISNYALPAQSYVAKRQSKGYLSINAYAGFFGGQEWIDDPHLTEKWKTNLAFSAPIGIEYSRRTRDSASISLFASVVDLGAVVSFRLNDNQTNDLPDLKFENILAPGLGLYYGFRKIPLSMGLNVQLSPRLRKFTATNATLAPNVAYRVGFSALIDIPIFQLYAR